MEENTIKDVFLIGGGPSVRDFDFSPYRDRVHMMGVNDAATNANCHSLFSMDGRWMFNRIFQFENTPMQCHLSEKHFCKWIKDYNKPWINLYKVDPYAVGMSESIDKLQGKNSGSAALNLVYLWKPQRVFLFGFDLTGDPTRGNKSEHWYGQYEWRAKRQHFHHFREALLDHKNSAKQFEAAGIKVYNVSPISLIKDYKRIHLNEVQNYFR